AGLRRCGTWTSITSRMVHSAIRCRVVQVSTGYVLSSAMFGEQILRPAVLIDRQRLRQNVVEHPAPQIGEPLKAPFVQVGEGTVLETEEVEDRGMQVAHQNVGTDAAHPEFVGRSGIGRGLNPGSGQPTAQAVLVVVASRLVEVGGCP